MKNLIALIVMGGLIILGTGCNLDDDIIVDNPVQLPEAVENFIADNFPGFQIRSSENEDLCDDTPVLEVELEDGPGPDVDLYFTPDGTFLFTAMDITPAELPEAVRDAIASDFPDYSINPDDVERFNYPDGTVEYEVELTHNTTGEDDDALYAADGTLLCFDDSPDDDNGGDDNGGDDNGGDDNGGDDDSTPVDLPEDVRDYISMNYPGYEIQSAETEDICDDQLVYEVELEHGPGPDIDLYFTTTWEFLLTATDISLADLPEAVRMAIANDFPDYSINADDIERFDYPDGTVEYEVELVHNLTGDDDDALYAADGTLLCFDDNSDDDNGGDDNGGDDDDDDGNDDDNPGVNLPPAVQNMINADYGGYIITSVEQEDICDDVLMYEVELEDGPGPDVELYFNLDWELQFTQMEISSSELPDAVLNTIATSYAGFEIDEDKVERQEWVTGETRFSVELESSEDDLEIIFNVDGSLYCLND